MAIHGYQCYCGSEDVFVSSTRSLVDDSECLTCYGDPNQLCGATSPARRSYYNLTQMKASESSKFSIALTEPKGSARDTPPHLAPIVFIFQCIWEKLIKLIGLCLLLWGLGPLSWKSWISHWFVNSIRSTKFPFEHIHFSKRNYIGDLCKKIESILTFQTRNYVLILLWKVH